MNEPQQPSVEPLGQPQGAALQPPKPDAEPVDDATLSRRASVKRWNDRVDKAEKHWENDFKRMRDNMDFVSGYQYRAQTKMEDDRYIANMTVRAINQKVAMLYARNPQVEAQRRKRLDFQLWDGKVESIQQAVMSVMQSMQAVAAGAMVPEAVPPQAIALLQDYQQGRQIQELVEKTGKTLEIVYQYECDTQEPDFKTQAKQFIRRVEVCGVGYMKVMFCREHENDLTHSETRMSVTDRVLRAQEILKRVEEGKIQEDSADVETLKSLVASLGMAPLDSEAASVKERLVFDFPQATSIIPDIECRSLKGFVGAHWVAERFDLSLEYVNAFFETDIKPGTDLLTYTQDGQPIIGTGEAKDQQTDPMKQKVKLYQVYDLDTKSTFVLCKGYKDYVMEPEPLTPAIKGFWNIFPLTFNDVEREAGCKATIFPPSDVQLLTPVQKEWNRCREALRNQRKANAPKYMAPKGVLTTNDKENIQAAEDNQIVELEGLPPGTKPSDVLQPFQHAAIDPACYDTKPLAEDAMLATGQQEANMGPAQPNVTATVGSIAEQSRMTVAASNVDDLDDCLSAVARAGGEMLLREMSPQTVQQIVGPGAAWPQVNREQFINEIELRIVAASSGRPNKALEVSNWQQIAPLIMQAAQLPPQAQPTMQAVIRETVKRADDRLEPADFFPLPVPALPVQGQPTQGGGAPPNAPKPADQQPPPRLADGGANVPLGGA